MAYDVHIGSSNKKHQYRLSLDEQNHHALMLQLSNSNHYYSLLPRLQDYWQDAQFSHKELSELSIDLNYLERVPPSPQLADFVSSLLLIVEEAQQQGFNVYFYSD